MLQLKLTDCVDLHVSLLCYASTPTPGDTGGTFPADALRACFRLTGQTFSFPLLFQSQTNVLVGPKEKNVYDSSRNKAFSLIIYTSVDFVWLSSHEKIKRPVVKQLFYQTLQAGWGGACASIVF